MTILLFGPDAEVALKELVSNAQYDKLDVIIKRTYDELGNFDVVLYRPEKKTDDKQ